jgi:hypothetical protein
MFGGHAMVLRQLYLKVGFSVLGFLTANVIVHGTIPRESSRWRYQVRE